MAQTAPPKTIPEDLTRLVDEINNKAENLFQQNAYPQAVEIAHSAMAIATGEDPEHPIYPSGVAHSLITIAGSSIHAASNVDSLGMLKQAVRLLDEKEDLRLRAKAYIGLSYYYAQKGDIATGNSYSHRAIVICEKHKYAFELVDAYVTHSAIMLLSGEHQKAERRLKAALKLANALDNPFLRSATNNNLAYVYLGQGNFTKAEHHARLAISELEGYPHRSYAIDTLGEVMFARGDLASAEALYRKAIEHDKHYDFAIGLGESSVNLANVLIKLGRPLEAEPFLLSSLKNATMVRHIPTAKTCHELLYKVYLLVGDSNKAYKHFKAYNDIQAPISPVKAQTTITNQTMSVLLHNSLDENAPIGRIGAAPSDPSRTTLEYLATTNPITGLMNAEQAATIGQSLFDAARTNETDLTLIYFVLENLHFVNGEHGEIVGDRLIINFSELLLRTANSPSQCAHLSENSFLLLEPGIPLKQSAQMAQHVQKYANGQISHLLVNPGGFKVKAHAVGIENKDATYQDLLDRAKAAIAAQPQSNTLVVL